MSIIGNTTRAETVGFIQTSDVTRRLFMSLERVDRTIGEREIYVAPPGRRDYVDAYGYTDGKNIWLNSDALIQNLKDRAILSDPMFVVLTRALNYHELAHVLYTPRSQQGGFLGTESNVDSQVTQMLLCLEEGRIESLFVVGKSSVAKILEICYSTLVNEPLPDGEEMPISGYVLCYGREYLTDHNSYLEPIPETDRITELCKEYNRLNLPAQSLKAVTIAKELVEMRPIKDGRQMQILEQDQPALRVGIPVPEKRKPDVDKSEAIGKINKEQLKDAVADAIEQAKKQAEKDLKEGAVPKTDPPAPKTEKIPEIVQAMMEDPDVMDLIADGINDMKRSMVDGQAALNRVPVEIEGEREASEGLSTERTRVVRAIRRMVADVESERQRRQYEGRMDLSRLMLNDTDMDVFRQQLPGQEDEIPVDVFFALDCSSSMRGERIDTAADACWMMHHAALAIPGSKFTSLGFNTEYAALIKRDTRATNKVVQPKAKGGTVIMEMLKEVAVPYLTQSPLANRYLIVASDGQWADRTGVATMVRGLASSGVSTIHFMISDYGDTEWEESFQYGHIVQNAGDIATISIKAFTETLRKYAQEMV